jgi:hypothetical protein
LFDIELLLFFEDFAAEALAAVRVFTEARARLLVALRLAAAAFFALLEALFLRVFCDTACARYCHAPVRCFYGNRLRHKIRMAGFGLHCVKYNTFSAKINDLRAALGQCGRFGLINRY